MPFGFKGPLLNVKDELRLAIANESSIPRLFEFVTDETILSEGGRSDTSFTTIGTVSEVLGMMMVDPLLDGMTIPLVPWVIVGGALAGRVGNPSVGMGISGALSLSSGDGVLSRFDTSTFGAK